MKSNKNLGIFGENPSQRNRVWIIKMWSAHRADAKNFTRLAEIKDDNRDGVAEVNRPSEIDSLSFWSPFSQGLFATRTR